MRKFEKLPIEGKKSEIIELEKEVKEVINTFGRIVASERKNKHISLKKLSQSSGVSIGVISDLENGKSKIPNLYTFIALAKSLGIDNQYFLELIFKDFMNNKETKKDPSEKLVDSLVTYGVPEGIAAQILVGIDLAYGKNKNIKNT